MGDFRRQTYSAQFDRIFPNMKFPIITINYQGSPLFLATFHHISVALTLQVANVWLFNSDRGMRRDKVVSVQVERALISSALLHPNIPVFRKLVPPQSNSFIDFPGTFRTACFNLKSFCGQNVKDSVENGRGISMLPTTMAPG